MRVTSRGNGSGKTKVRHYVAGALGIAAAGTASLLYGYSHSLAHTLFGLAALVFVLAFVIVDEKVAKDEDERLRNIKRATERSTLPGHTPDS
ncbi:MAG: hypothetical protein KJ832_10795 [Gammaproteobacteria bacterium]|nr:hypothetical protein [Gammaproteobacteria bacterium]